MQWKESALTIRGMKIACRRLKTSENPKNHILAAHGWLDNAATFETLGPLIKDADIIALDLAGHGFSDHRSACSSYAFQEYLFDYFEIIDYINRELRWNDFVLMGHSMGTIISTLFASAQSQGLMNINIRKMVLFDFIGTLNESETITHERLNSALKSYAKLRRMPEVCYDNFEDAVSARLNKSDMQPEHAAMIMKRNLIEKEGKLCWRFDKNLLQTSPVYLTPGQTSHIVRSVTNDVLLIAGSRSPFIRLLRERVKEYQQTLDTIYYEEFEGGHYVHLENLEECAASVNKFLEN